MFKYLRSQKLDQQENVFFIIKSMYFASQTNSEIFPRHYRSCGLITLKPREAQVSFLNLTMSPKTTEK